jgi:putative two-component system response regulator
MARTGSFENAGATLEELSVGIEAIRQSLRNAPAPAPGVVRAEVAPARSSWLPADRRKRVLVVDDDETTRKITQAMVEALGYDTETARDGIDALSKLPLSIDLILLDVMMPGLDGFLVCRRIREDSHGKDIPVIMVTSMASREDRLNAVEAGANDFIAKPVDETELRVRLTSILKMKEAQDELHRYQDHLEDMVEQRTASLSKALEGMAEAQQLAYMAQLETVERLAIVAEYKDQVTAKHIRRMSEYCAVIARGLKLPPSEVELILYASLMHDVGKIAVPDAILQKPARLDTTEWDVMRLHPRVGSRILALSSSEILEAGRVIALYHHERWDGAGYPHGLAGEKIPLWGRICAVADAFDAVTNERPYKPAYPNEEAIRLLREGRGTQFDPRVVDVFLDCFDEILAIQAKYRELDRRRDDRPG